MDYLAKWKTLLRNRDRPYFRYLYFLDVILKGYGQVLVCLNPLTGLLLAVAIFYLSGTIGLLTLLGVVSSTLTAFALRAKYHHVNAGVYGFNGVILGIAWLWFFKLNVLSGVLFVLAACLSSVLMKLGMYVSSRTRTNLPVLSVPCVVLIWLALALARRFIPSGDLAGPDSITFQHIIVLSLIFLGILAHSRISAMFSLTAFLTAAVMVYLLGGVGEFKDFDLYLYNAVPLGLALGGTFLALNRKVFLFTVFGVIVVVWLVFMGMRYFPLPVFIAPFNFTAILFIWLVKARILKREQGFYAVPMELVFTPESGLKWYKGELYAEIYWHKF